MIELEIFQTASDAAHRVAELALEQVAARPASVLGLATGSTPIAIYQDIVRQVRAGRVVWDQVTTFNLDEYVGLCASDPHSFTYYMQQHLFGPLGMRKQKWFMPPHCGPDLAQIAPRYDQTIADHGGIDWQLLGIGRNGHIGFNEPGTPFDSLTHVATLSESTRQANAAWFDGHLDDVPQQAVTMGLATIMAAGTIVLAAFGESKAWALEKLLKEPPTPAVPASVLTQHPHVLVIADQAAASRINALAGRAGT
ncbi:MAG: glucosamine-6-phosphate deaminase [Sulfobacillus thermosulfidooxidans]|uniref:Glucosamine/galactosamine-6-phosphate isomerase domain-containing protein n=1 Tax=Sulfobacillus thermotolerans TaxID=338644 RepID=A0ABM6RU84_9FIRM|nr:glucosamine-6-phosphate deaminase [Sulfobacillus sp. hq2]AUW95024.1 hypothetical protein BXT84_14545 [Sulfobacillus thermotolerans]POB10376.1 glucosamine-6-phosphate deaminase [Sulfobacillus sp. hq2]PSR37898.1 MAG: glucosamine-6-phosphate deaminase [Sulfobacillus thermosulfidooxidans]